MKRTTQYRYRAQTALKDRVGRERARRAVTRRSPEMPVTLIFPPGGFGLPARRGLMDPAAEAARQAGFWPVAVYYPVRDPPAALAHAIAVARRTRAVFAYGESAGGTLAARLAQLGLIERASLNAPISNLFTWGFPDWRKFRLREGWGLTEEELRHISPMFHETHKPIDIIHSPTDQIVPYADSVEWLRRDPAITLRQIEGDHISGPTHPENLTLSFRLLRGEGDV